MTNAAVLDDADRGLKARHRAMWALGDYPKVASDLIAELGSVLVEECGIRPGDRVLDVAAGSGNASIPAARRGARVVAADLTPELLERGRDQAAHQGEELEWREADAEALPFADGEFDRVISCVGVMFAPHHQAAADELLRVCRTGGTIGVASWTPEGFIGEMLTTMRPYQPPPPPGVQPPLLWGAAEHVRELLGDRVVRFQARRRMVTVDCFPTPEAFRDYFKSHYGPTVAAYRALEGDPAQSAALDRELADLARRHDRGSSNTVLDWEYLLVTAERS